MLSNLKGFLFIRSCENEGVLINKHKKFRSATQAGDVNVSR